MATLLDHGFIFLAMVFAVVFLLGQSLVIPAFGENRRLRRQLRERLDRLAREPEGVRQLRQKRTLPDNRLLRWLEQQPLFARLRGGCEQAGWSLPGYALLGWAGAGAVLGGGAGLLLPFGTPGVALLALGGAAAPFLWLQRTRNQRLARFDEQLPEALDVIVRALRAGHPFNESLRLVTDEMTDPIAHEFRQTFNDINYGGDLRTALYDLTRRVPSVNVTAMVTAILIQKETGGNLAEILDKLAQVVRGRFRFQRKVRTLSAEARMSAWILTLIPFGLFIAISLLNPDYLPMLTESETGQRVILYGFLLVVAGVFWMRRLVRIDI